MNRKTLHRRNTNFFLIHSIIALNPPQQDIIISSGREIIFKQTGADIALVQFDELCRTALAAGDFLIIADRFKGLLMQDVPVLGDDQRDAARRFMWLVDALYDRGRFLVIGAAVECIHAYSLIHDDLPCMDDDSIRRGKPSAHIKFGEATAVLAGNSLLTMAFEILSHKDLRISEKIKIDLINKISESSGHLGIAGGQYLDLNYERKKISQKKIEGMEIKKTGKLFSFCCAAPLIIKKKNKSDIKKFENIGADIGLLFQVADDLIDYKGSLLVAGKKTGKDKKKGKATLISLLGYKNTIKYANNLILRIKSKLKKYGSKSRNLSETLNYILSRNKWKKNTNC